MNIECPICNSNLIHTRVDDGVSKHEISTDGKIISSYSHSDGYDSVACSNDTAHEIPETLQEVVLDLI